MLGKIDYYRIKLFNIQLGEPFNGQKIRQEIFLGIIKKLNTEFIIETGTFQGTTSIYMHSISGLPVYTIKNDRRYYIFSKKRFWPYSGITICFGNSVEVLDYLRLKKELCDAKLFFYLDAHWDWYLPLEDELKIIFNNWNDAVVMVDDFQVPDDPDYRYDSYFNGKALNFDLLNSISDINFSIFLPKERGVFETGARKGAIILAKSQEIIERLKMLSSLRFYKNVVT
jgi:hypothetical protein